MIRVINKRTKEEVKVYSYHKYQSLHSEGYDSSYESCYHLYLNAEDAKKFSVKDEVEVAWISGSFTVKSISHLDDNSFCVELIYREEIKSKKEEEELVSPAKDCKLDNDCDCDCCNCDKETKKEGGIVDGLNDLLNGLEGGNAKKNLPKHLICVFSDGDKDTIAFELKDGEAINVSTAKCHKKDKFDFHTGAKYAMARLTKDVSTVCDADEDDKGVWVEGDDVPTMDAYSPVVIKVGDFVRYTDGLNDTYGAVVKQDGKYYVANRYTSKEIKVGSDITLVWRP